MPKSTNGHSSWLGLPKVLLASLAVCAVLAIGAGSLAIWSQEQQLGHWQYVKRFQQLTVNTEHWLHKVSRTQLIGRRVHNGLARYKGELAYLNDSQTKAWKIAQAEQTSYQESLAEADVYEAQIQNTLKAVLASWKPIEGHHDDLLTGRNRFLTPTAKHYTRYKANIKLLYGFQNRLLGRHKSGAEYWSGIDFYACIAALSSGSLFIIILLAWVLAPEFSILRTAFRLTYKKLNKESYFNPVHLQPASTSRSVDNRFIAPSNAKEETIQQPSLEQKVQVDQAVQSELISTQGHYNDWQSETWFEFSLPENLKIIGLHPVWVSEIGSLSLGYEGAAAKTFAEMVNLVHPDQRYTFIQVLRTHLQDLTGTARFHVFVKLASAKGVYQEVEFEATTQRAENGMPQRMRGYWRPAPAMQDSMHISQLKQDVA